MSIFKKSYARGVTDTLGRAGLVKFASIEIAEKVADVAGANWDVDPSSQQVTVEKLAALADTIVELAKHASGTSTLITGNQAHQANTPEEAAKHSPLAALDQALRPQGTYAKGEKGVGQTDFKAPAAAIVGHEEAHSLAPGVTDHKANSVNTFGKAASLNEMIRKIASGTGSLVTGDNAEQSNTPANASKESPLAALDEKNRPQGTYAKGEKGVGTTELDTKPGVVGKEQPHEKAPGATDSKPNSIVEHSKTAAYIARFEETAREYVPQLPATMSDDEKVASIKMLMGFEPEEANHFLVRLAEESKTPSGLADLLESKEEKKETPAEEKKETPAEEKKEEKKEEHVAEKCSKCDKSPCECKKDEEKKASARTRRVDPYGYKGYDGKNIKKASNVLAGIKGLTSR
jgi:hypothetical protein